MGSTLLNGMKKVELSIKGAGKSPFGYWNSPLSACSGLTLLSARQALAVLGNTHLRLRLKRQLLSPNTKTESAKKKS